MARSVEKPRRSGWVRVSPSVERRLSGSTALPEVDRARPLSHARPMVAPVGSRCWYASATESSTAVKN